jgi:hypothetical protein
MTKCTKCKLSYPDHLVVVICPLCALLLRNETHGLPLNTPFTGEMANVMYEEAVEYKQKHYEKN